VPPECTNLLWTDLGCFKYAIGAGRWLGTWHTEALKLIEWIQKKSPGRGANTGSSRPPENSGG
jgi:hypothetical protein